ncbi:MAG: ATPase [Bacteroidales bacterium]|nr:ATPase [Bacteroidales bacterium]
MLVKRNAVTAQVDVREIVGCLMYSSYFCRIDYQTQTKWPMLLIADSGSTKTDWLLLPAPNRVVRLQTIGLNPIFLSLDEMCNLLRETFVDYRDEVTEVFFYGAGCVPDRIPGMEAMLRDVFPKAATHVASDLLGAARALCGHEPGIACILGTGSNSCYYDGIDIVHNVSPLGFILGDEGSGAVFGRQLLADYLKQQMPLSLRKDFDERYHITISEAIETVYRQPRPNRYLANLARFIAFHLDSEYINELVRTQFLAFFQRNVMQYEQCRNVEISFVGSVAFYLQSQLNACAEMLGLKLGKVVQSPIDLLAVFHTPTSIQLSRK